MKERHGLVDNWLRHIQDVQHQHEGRLQSVQDPAQRIDRLCELNVIEQISNVCRTSIVEDAWARGQQLTIHGWIYGIHDGLLRDLNVTAKSAAEAATGYRRAVESLSPI
jgi:carbonic anhydrase